MPRDRFASFTLLRAEMDERFAGGLQGGGSALRRGFSPRVDVFYEGDPPRAVVIAELPGVDISELELEIEGRRLVLAGVRRGEPAAQRVYQQIEIEHGPFRRTVELGAEVAGEDAKATYEDGVLRVEVPLVGPERGRRVPIGRSDG